MACTILYKLRNWTARLSTIAIAFLVCECMRFAVSYTSLRCSCQCVCSSFFVCCGTVKKPCAPLNELHTFGTVSRIPIQCVRSMALNRFVEFKNLYRKLSSYSKIPFLFLLNPAQIDTFFAILTLQTIFCGCISLSIFVCLLWMRNIGLIQSYLCTSQLSNQVHISNVFSEVKKNMFFSFKFVVQVLNRSYENLKSGSMNTEQ